MLIFRTEFKLNFGTMIEEWKKQLEIPVHDAA